MTQAVFDNGTVFQVCFVTDDLEKMGGWLADLTGSALPEIKAPSADNAIAEYRGRTIGATYRLMIFRFDNLDIEILEPGPEKSAWRDVLEEKGPGFHHLGFRTRDMKRDTQIFLDRGHALIQKGEFPSKTGRYAYFDTRSGLGELIELLEYDIDKTGTQASA